MKTSKLRKVMVFGAFDHFHKGHRYFLEKAKKEGDILIVVVTPDHIIRQIKGNLPRDSFEKRKKRVEKEKIAQEIVSGDSEQGKWKILKKHKPDVIVLGYDQKKLGEALKEALIKLDISAQIKTVEPFQPGKYHSRFLKNPRNTVRIFGKVERGEGKANILGFPTINLPLTENHPSGIYAGKAHIHGIEYKAAIYIGPKKDIIEAHLINFKTKENLYDRWAIIEIGKKIRDTVRTKSLQEIKELIKKDVKTIEAM